ncbi:FtsQ-type POTRA domain-containing protein [Umezawaea sp. Da 62-37]|uniref:cell division protein FtsQ/DivIB n=1 Tax=Umezawaea sp. Da 62-37 TaxID=3075927 RepID=UPI0028F6CF4F|nr:FtsQ-type POTRA domain-containing protein [Umezawaea sp. Da 62-37]WNV89721.1 FtsQ-type POTRA domain-containing protein [Umezawaea sp. Da 62-37]
MSTPVRGRPPRTAGTTSAADRARARRARRVPGRVTRRQVRRRRAVALLVLLTVVGLVVGVFFTPMLGVRDVDVRGAKELTVDQVRAKADIEPGSPIVRVDVHGIADRVRSLPRVESVEVARSLPGTVRLTIVERSPVAFARSADGVHLVDASAKDYATVANPPIGLPELLLAVDAQPALKAAVGVLTQLPDTVKAEVQTIAAQTGADVKLAMSGGREVRWGSLADTQRKAAVLAVLLTREGSVFDVSSPELPTVS